MRYSRRARDLELSPASLAGPDAGRIRGRHQYRS